MSEAQQDTSSWRGTDEGNKLKELAKCYTDGGQTSCATSGFGAVLAGYRGIAGGFYSRGTHTYLWSSSQSSTTNAWRRFLHSGYSTVYRDSDSKAYGFSLRCLQD